MWRDGKPWVVWELISGIDTKRSRSYWLIIAFTYYTKLIQLKKIVLANKSISHWWQSDQTSSFKGESRKAWNKTIHPSGQWKDWTPPACQLVRWSPMTDANIPDHTTQPTINQGEGLSEEEPRDLLYLLTKWNISLIISICKSVRCLGWTSLRSIWYSASKGEH